MPRSMSQAGLPAALEPNLRVYAPGATGESPVLTEALRAAPEASRGVTYTGVWLPGINHVDYASLHPEARAEAYFMGPDQRPSFEAGRTQYFPLSYYQIYRRFLEGPAPDLALLHLSSPDVDGRCSLGLANDFTPAILGRTPRLIAHINPAMPRTMGAAKIAYDDLEAVIEAEAPLPTEPPGAATAGGFEAIARHLSGLVRDGDILQVGIGRVQAVLAGFADRRDLLIHAGIIGDGVMALARAGALADRPGAVTTGVAYGSPELYRFAAEDGRVRFAPVGYTHDTATLRAIPRLVAINSVIEIDLLGQANAESVDGRQISSAGGITDFLRGARLSDGGLPIVALQATAKRGSVSRIVPQLPAGAPVSVPRGDIGLVVTEYGIADLRDKSVDGRAEALIGIAAPDFRDELAEAWAERRRGM
jgi:acyl-CoA hydrolase